MECWYGKICYVDTCKRVTARFEGSAGMGRFAMLSLETERLDGLRGVLVWEDLLCYHLQKSDWTV